MTFSRQNGDPFPCNQHCINHLTIYNHAPTHHSMIIMLSLCHPTSTIAMSYNIHWTGTVSYYYHNYKTQGLYFTTRMLSKNVAAELWLQLCYNINVASGQITFSLSISYAFKVLIFVRAYSTSHNLADAKRMMEGNGLKALRNILGSWTLCHLNSAALGLCTCRVVTV